LIGSARSGLGSARTASDDAEQFGTELEELAADVAAIEALIPAGATGLLVSGVTPVIDFLAAPTNYALSFPLVPAPLELIGVIARLRWVTRTGTATGNLVYSIGTNAPNYDNFVTAAQGTVTAATITAAVNQTTLAVGAGGLSVDLSTLALRLRIVTLPTGVTAASGYFAHVGMYVQASP
jgi:hypothetical protein